MNDVFILVKVDNLPEARLIRRGIHKLYEELEIPGSDHIYRDDYFFYQGYTQNPYAELKQIFYRTKRAAMAKYIKKVQEAK